MMRVTTLQQESMDKFFRFLCMGKSLTEYASKNDLHNFRRLFFESDDYEIMFWHITKAFKAALKERSFDVLDFLINDLLLCIDHDAFRGVIHIFLYNFTEDEFSIELKSILRLLVKSKI